MEQFTCHFAHSALQLVLKLVLQHFDVAQKAPNLRLNLVHCGKF